MTHNGQFATKVTLGSTGLSVSRLGLGSSYAAPTAAYREAFERGVNYFYWGSRRRDFMGDALRELAPQHRDKLIVVVQSYARFGWMMKRSLESALKNLKLSYADVLLLGWHNSAPGARLLDAAMDLVGRGLVRHIALSGHHRPMFPTLLDDPRYGIWHVRYNAVHCGAEREVFSCLDGRGVGERPGVVTYTSTRWGHLCDPERMPPGERTPSGTDCYRFALSDPRVNVAIAGPKSLAEMRQALDTLTAGPLSDEEGAWMRRVGAHIYGRDSTTRLRDGV
ncbi:MAG: aldo/keto reductase [Myxococcales bacterium]|nr:aldo/keto reductase [Myxococcales bacterium]